MKRRAAVLVINKDMLRSETRTMLKVIAYHAVIKYGALSDLFLSRLMSESYSKLFSLDMTSSRVARFLSWEKDSAHGVLTGPAGNPSQATFLRKSNITPELKMVIDCMKDDVLTSFNGREEDDIFTIIGINN